MKFMFKAILLFSSMIILVTGCTFPLFNTPASPTQTPPPTPTLMGQVVVTTTSKPLSIARLPAGTELKLSTIHMFSLTNGWAIGMGGSDANEHILRTTNGGIIWKDITPPDSPVIPYGKQAGAFFMNDNTAWVSYSAGQPVDNTANIVVWATKDGGTTWVANQPLDLGATGAESYFPNPIYFTDAQHGWLLAHVGVGMSHDYVMLFSTTDGGNTWARLLDPNEEHGMPMVITKTGMVFTDAQHGWVTGESLGLTSGQGYYPAVTVDGGASWTLLTLTAPVDAPTLFTDTKYSCGFRNPVLLTPQLGMFQMVCMSIDNNFQASWVYVTDNAGQTWMSKRMPPGLGSVYFLNPSTGWFVAEGRIYKTTDYAKTWNQISTVTWGGMPDFVNETNGWLIATTQSESALVKSVDGGITWTIIVPVSE
jgi:photosystem II stability/assembly factor-like uncharacterized protein